MSKRILVAGIGNIFLGDDAFGVEAVRELAQRTLPEGVEVVDFGIRSHDLAFALMDEHDAVILIDATPRGYAPGTLYLIEPDFSALIEAEGSVPNGHGMDVVRALQMAKWLGGRPGRLYLVGCEPAALESEDGQIGLSDAVRAAVPRALAMVESVLLEVLADTHREAALVPV